MRSIKAVVLFILACMFCSILCTNEADAQHSHDFIGHTIPRAMIMDYLFFLRDVGFLENFSYIYITHNQSPDAGLIKINDKVLGKILDDMTEYFAGKYITAEIVVGGINEALQAKGCDLSGLGAMVFDYIDNDDGLRYAIEDMGYFLGIDLDMEITVATNLVYPAINDMSYLGETQQAWSRPEITITMREFLQMNQIKSLIAGVRERIITEGFYKAMELADSAEMKAHLGGSIDVNNPEHLSTLIYFGQISEILSTFSPRDFIVSGQERSFDQIRDVIPTIDRIDEAAYYRNTIKQIEAFCNDWLIRVDKEGRIIDSKSDIPDSVVDNYISTMLSLAAAMQDKLNQADYYGRQLSIADPYEIGLINSWVSTVFDKLREKNYDPASQSFTGKYTLKDATDSITNFIDIAKDLKPALEAVYGSLPITENGFAGEHARNLVNVYSNLALTLQENGIVANKNDAVSQVSQLLLPGVSNGGALLNKFKELYAAAGVSKNYSYFKTDKGGQMAYASFLTVAISLLDYDNYFAIQDKSFDGIFGSNGALADMMDTGLRMGLVDKIKEYLGVSGSLGIDEGYIAGIYTFWNQVLYAVVNNLGEEKGQDYVWQQLDARTQLRQVLQDKGIYTSASVTKVGILGAFERGLDGSLNNLQSSLSAVINLINSQGIDRANYQDKLASGVLDSLSDPEFNLYPQSKDDANIWNWSDLYAGGGLATFDFETDEIAVIGDPSPEFGATSAPILF